MGDRRSDDVERLMRIRDQQLRARDPHIKDRKMHQRISRKYTAQRRPQTTGEVLRDLVKDFPYKWRGVLIGFVLGIAADVALVLFTPPGTRWATIVGLAIIIVLPIVGFFVGSIYDWKKDLVDDVKKL